MTYKNQQILIGNADIIAAVKTHYPQAIITAEPFELVPGVVKNVKEPDYITDPDGEDTLEVELQTQTGEAIHLPGRTPLLVFTEESDGVDWFPAPAGVPHLEKETGIPPKLQIWKAQYDCVSIQWVNNIQVHAYTEWQARLAVAPLLADEPEVIGGYIHGYDPKHLPKCPYFWMSSTHTTFTVPVPEPLKEGKVTFTRGSYTTDY